MLVNENLLVAETSDVRYEVSIDGGESRLTETDSEYVQSRVDGAPRNRVSLKPRAPQCCLNECDHPLHPFSFTSDPLTDIQWAVVYSHSVRFVDPQKFYSLTVHRTEVFEIESQHVVFLFQQCSKHVHVVPCKSSTDAQNHTTLSDCLAVDFAGHCKRLSGVPSELA